MNFIKQKCITAAVLLLVAILSITVVGKYVSAPENHQKTIASHTFQDVTPKTAATTSLFSHHTSGTVSADPSMSFCPRYSDNG